MTYEEIKTLLTDTEGDVADQAAATLANARNVRRNHLMASTGARGAGAYARLEDPAREWVAERVSAFLSKPEPFDFKRHLDSPTYADCWCVARAIEAIRAGD